MVTIPPIDPMRVRWSRTYFTWDHGTDVKAKVTENRPGLLTHLSRDGRAAVVIDDEEERHYTISTGQLLDEQGERL